MQPRIKFSKLIKKEPWPHGIEQALIVFSLSLTPAALCYCISALSHTMLFYSVEPTVQGPDYSYILYCVPLHTERAMSLCGIKTPAVAHWIAALYRHVPDLSSVLSSRLLNNKCCVVKVHLRVLIIAEVSRRRTWGGWQGEPAEWLLRIPPQLLKTLCIF